MSLKRTDLVYLCCSHISLFSLQSRNRSKNQDVHKGRKAVTCLSRRQLGDCTWILWDVSSRKSKQKWDGIQL